MFLFTVFPRVTYCNNEPAGSYHTLWRNKLKSYKGNLDCYSSGTQNDKCGWNRRTFLRIQTVPSVCLNVSLAGNRPPTYTKEVFLSGEESYPALSVQLGSTLALKTHLAWVHCRERWLTFYSPTALTHAAPASAGCGHYDVLWGTM